MTLVGMATTRRVVSIATNSASGVEWGTHVCRLLIIAAGYIEFGPQIAAKDPVVDLWVCKHPAKSASER